MDTEECIEFLEQDKYNTYNNDIGILKKYNEKINEVIKRLQMWETFKNEYGKDFICPACTSLDMATPLENIKDVMDKYEKEARNIILII